MPEDRTPRIVAPTESIPEVADSPSTGRSPRRESHPRASEHGEAESRAQNRRSERDWPGRTSDEEEEPSGKDRIHFPLFP